MPYFKGREQLNLLRQELLAGRITKDQLMQLRRAQQSGQLSLGQLTGVQQLMQQLPPGMLQTANLQEVEERIGGSRLETEEHTRIFGGGQRPFGRRRFRGPTAAKYQQVNY